MAYQRKQSTAAKRAASKRKQAPSVADTVALELDARIANGRLSRTMMELFASDALDHIVRADLTSALWCLEQDYERRKSTADSLAVFETNRKKDIAALKKHIEAMKIVLRYYTVGGTEI